MAERRIPLKYPAQCRRCGRALVVGELARWDSETRVTTCVRCPSRSSTLPAAVGHAGTAVSTPVPRPQRQPAEADGAGELDPWQRLVQQHLRAVRAQSVPAPPRVRSTDWVALALQHEGLVTGREDTLALTRDAHAFMTATDDDSVTYYGWPTLVTADPQGAPCVVPVLITELAGPDGREAWPVDDEPHLNPALLVGDLFPPDDVAVALAAVDNGLAFGDPEAVAAGLGRFLSLLGVEAPAIDPDAVGIATGMEPALHNTAVLVRGPSSVYTRGLAEELALLAQRTDWRHTAAAWLAMAVDDASGAVPDPGAPPAEGIPETDDVAAFEGLLLNDSQEQAVAAALERPLTVVTGPPGTGKSQLVAAIVGNQWLRGRSVLVASTNNGAVDVAVARCAAIDPALLIRTGNMEHRETLSGVLEELIERGRIPGEARPAVVRRLEIAAAERRTLHERLSQRTVVESRLATTLVAAESWRQTLWGTPEAPQLQVPLSEALRGVRRAGRARWFRTLRRDRALRRLPAVAAGATFEDVIAWADAEDEALGLLAEVETLGTASPSDDRAALAAVDTAWAQAGTTALRDTLQGRLHVARTALDQLARTRRGARRARVEAMRRAVQAVPGWACTALSARSNFPLEPGLFDLLVLDEASQCSIAHVLPLAYRARRIVVVGDPNQLTPVVTLDRRAQEAIARAVGSTSAEEHRQARSVGEDSAYTAYAARCADGPVLLDEHYRCHPAIARFFNEHFYGGMLRILTDVAHDTEPRGLSLVEVAGETTRGHRGRSSRNVAEVDAVVRWLAERPTLDGSIGAVTPFAAQADLLQSRLVAELGRERGSRVRVGTAHRFQGDECDVVLFSAVVSEGAAPMTAAWVEQQRNLVNVAVSRARRALVVFADKAAVATAPVPTLRALVDLAADGSGGPSAGEGLLRESRALHSEAERRLFAALAQRGIDARAKVVVEGYELDLVIDGPTGPVDVEVDGAQHRDARGRQRRQDLARDRVVEALGWRVVRVPAWRCLVDADAVAAELAKVREPAS